MPHMMPMMWAMMLILSMSSLFVILSIIYFYPINLKISYNNKILNDPKKWTWSW
uniref:ATP synthase F0 subunit 8 n=1 Tax=Anoplolepis gracilipes TaxID=354296 RepID=A0A346KN53_ANOGC|nr:ATP synthase F0 subunit 8 [Anoplolepis gracilipes]AXP85344.1 ATP synthase F0 subunit 8 [Anoplolepis gracilipes]